MKGFTKIWYEICNIDGHALVLSEGSNNFSTETEALAAVVRACTEYSDTVTIKEHTTVILRVFSPQVTVVEA
jgi:hypothetical protein